MARQSLMWTALPNGRDGNELRGSVLLSPRVDPQADPQRVDSFAEWIDWPQTLRQATITVHYGGGKVAIPATQTQGDARVDETLGGVDSAVWKALFRPDLFVRPHTFEDLTGQQIISFDATAIDALVQNLYSQLAGQASGDMPLYTDFLNDPD